MRVDAESQLGPYLEPGERILWSGTPRRGLAFRRSDAVLIPFSLLWAGFAVFWEAMVVTTGAPLIMVLWGVPFVLIGVYIVVGRFFVDARVRANTIYGLTDRRVIIIRGLFSRSVTSLGLAGLQDISLTERADRSGTVLLGRPQRLAGWHQGMQWPGTSGLQVPALEMIQNARVVHDRLLEAQRAAG